MHTSTCITVTTPDNNPLVQTNEAVQPANTKLNKTPDPNSNPIKRKCKGYAYVPLVEETKKEELPSKRARKCPKKSLDFDFSF